MKELWELLKSVLEWAKERKAPVFTALVLVIINLVIDRDFVPDWLPWLHFYGQDVLEDKPAWVFLFVILAIGSLILSWHWLGFTIIAATCLVLAVFFGINYGSNPSGTGDWLFIIWLAYRSLLALLIGPCVRVASYVATR